MVKLVDTPGLGPGTFSLAGSSPAARNNLKKLKYIWKKTFKKNF